MFNCSFVINGESKVSLKDNDKIAIKELDGTDPFIKLGDSYIKANVCKVDITDPRPLMKVFEVSGVRYGLIENRKLDVLISGEKVDMCNLDLPNSDLYKLTFKDLGGCIEIDDLKISITHKENIKLKRVKSCYKCSNIYSGDDCYCVSCLGGNIKNGKYEGMSYLWVITNDRDYALYYSEHSDVEEERQWFRRNLSAPPRLLATDGIHVSPRPVEIEGKRFLTKFHSLPSSKIKYKID